MMTLLLIGLVVMLMLAIVALSYKHKAEQQAQAAAHQKTISDAALGQIEQRNQLDQSLSALATTQREETLHDTNPTHLAERSDFDNDGSAAGLHSAGTGADHAASPAVADPAGVTEHRRRRADLSE